MNFFFIDSDPQKLQDQALNLENRGENSHEPVVQVKLPLQTISTSREQKVEIPQEHRTDAVQPQNKKAKKVKTINNCETKNCLNLFQTAHCRFLQYEGINTNDYPQLAAFQKKCGAAKEDFTKIYRIEQFQQVWEKMFQAKFLHRYIMTSRSFPKQKITSMKYIGRLKRAFQTKQRF